MRRRRNAAMTMIAPTEEPEALRLQGLTRAFRAGARTVVAVDGVDATVMRGTITGLIGPDGAGKTTLMRLSLGLLRPDRGRIEVMGIDVARQPAQAQARIGYMPQRFGLYEDLTVQENLDLYAKLQGVASAQRGARYRDLLHMTGLEPFTARLAGRLSGGMKQKLGLACTLIRVPELLILDEPTVGVDPVSRRELWAIVDRLVRAEKITVLVSTSYLDEAERCQAVLLMHEGRIVGAASPRDFTAPLAGRTFQVAAASVGKRHLQARLAAAPGVVDATIQGGSVRLVMQEPTPPSAAVLLPGVPDVSVTPVAARFEDAFVALLKARDGSGSGGSVSAAPPRGRPAGAPDGDGVVIAARGLTRRFGDFVAVDDVSFEVRTGEIFGLLGANGAGKTTTFRMLCGLLPPSAGTLQVAGIDLRTAASEARRRVGYMAQKFSLYGDLSVMQNLRFFGSAYRLQGARRRERLDSAVQEFGLGAMLDRVARDLPLGYKQRLALACALMHEPDILFLDEPTSGVDPLARREFWRRINALAEGGVTVLVTTHFMEEAEYCDRLVIMAQGRILQAGDAASLKARARSAAIPDPTMEDAFVALIGAAAERRAA